MLIQCYECIFTTCPKTIFPIFLFPKFGKSIFLLNISILTLTKKSFQCFTVLLCQVPSLLGGGTVFLA